MAQVKSFRGRADVVGVLGGAFDPPHVGHALLPGYLLARGLVDRVVVAPVADHPLGKSMRPFAERLEMTRAAMALYDDRVKVDEIEGELARLHGGPSLSLRLLEALARREPAATVRLVVGADIVASGETARWHRWDEIERSFAPIVVPRVGFSPPGECALPRVSSTEIRAWLSSSDPADLSRLEAALPAAVLGWLRPRPDAPVWIVGQGNVGTHAVPWLRGRGIRATSVPGRAAVSGAEGWPAGEVPSAIWILVRDPAIADVARAIAALSIPRHVPVLHGAGARPAAEVLAPASDAGHPIGTLHPICALRRERPFPSPLRRAAFGLEGDGPAREAALALVGDAPWLDLQGLGETDRQAYHGACALVANHLAVLWDAGSEVLRRQGHAPELADLALGELLASALGNLVSLGIPAGVTGPVARGDMQAVAAHVAALPQDAAALYADLSQRLAGLMTRPR